MSGGRVEEFLAATPLPLGTPVEEVEGRLGPAARVLTRDGRPTGFAYPAQGIWLAAEDGIVTSISFLTGTADGDGVRYTGTLPGGLTVGDPPERVVELYGPPDRIQRIPLARPPKARMILSFYDLDAPASLLVAVKSEHPERLDRLVLTRRA